jgi:5-methylcytosine-specific restriction endonuclease McrA
MSFSPGPRTKSQVWFKTGGRCWYCGVHMDPFTGCIPESATIDHFVPYKDDAADRNSLINLVPCCFQCNQLKGHGTIKDLRALLKSLKCSNSYEFYFEKKKLVIGSVLYLNN